MSATNYSAMTVGQMGMSEEGQTPQCRAASVRPEASQAVSLIEALLSWLKRKGAQRFSLNRAERTLQATLAAGREAHSTFENSSFFRH